MEKIAIISDVHANITALNTVLDDIRKKGIKRIFCLGDIVTKGANPDIAIELVKTNCEIVLRGNCDEIMSSDMAFERKFWTRMKIGEEKADYLRNLPIMHEFYLSGHLVRLFHASPCGIDLICNPAFSNADTKYADREIHDPLKMFENTELIGKTDKDHIPDIVGYGHIHTPNLFRFKNKMLFNTGSVGAPNEMLNLRDENDKTNNFSTLSSYTILEGEYNSKKLSSISISNVRIPYDISKEIEMLKKSDMPGKEERIISLKTASDANYK